MDFDMRVIFFVMMRVDAIYAKSELDKVRISTARSRSDLIRSRQSENLTGVKAKNCCGLGADP